MFTDTPHITTICSNVDRTGTTHDPTTIDRADKTSTATLTAMFPDTASIANHTMIAATTTRATLPHQFELRQYTPAR